MHPDRSPWRSISRCPLTCPMIRSSDATNRGFVARLEVRHAMARPAKRNQNDGAGSSRRSSARAQSRPAEVMGCRTVRPPGFTRGTTLRNRSRRQSLHPPSILRQRSSPASALGFGRALPAGVAGHAVVRILACTLWEIRPARQGRTCLRYGMSSDTSEGAHGSG